MLSISFVNIYSVAFSILLRRGRVYILEIPYTLQLLHYKHGIIELVGVSGSLGPSCLYHYGDDTAIQWLQYG
jgi:hypothetical protein